MPKAASVTKGKSKPSKQPKLPDYRVSSDTQKANEDMADDDDASKGEALVGATADVVLAAISSMKTEFTSRFDGVMAAIESMRREINECTERVSQTELRISTAEDDVAGLQAKVNTLESKNKTLEDKLLDLETRSRLNNLRLVGLPEGAEGHDPCAFLEKWIPEVPNRTSEGPKGATENTYNDVSQLQGQAGSYGSCKG